MAGFMEPQINTDEHRFFIYAYGANIHPYLCSSVVQFFILWFWRGRLLHKYQKPEA